MVFLMVKIRPGFIVSLDNSLINNGGHKTTYIMIYMGLNIYIEYDTHSDGRHILILRWCNTPYLYSSRKGKLLNLNLMQTRV